MTHIDHALLETLLHRSESDVLDFKSKQYVLAGGTEYQKSELVKDIVAFANAWRDSDAHIVIGAKDGRGKRAEVVEVTHHLDDADLQELVNKKTNRPVTFNYVPTTIDGRKIAIIRIAQGQQRPIALTKDFGKLRANVVYVRRGSSTDEADVDEVGRMAIVQLGLAKEPKLILRLGDPRRQQPFDVPMSLLSKVVERSPEGQEEDRLFGTLASVQSAYLGKPSPQDVFEYKKQTALVSEVAFCVSNAGQVLLEGVRVVLDVPKVDDLALLDAPVEEPRSPLDRVFPSLRGHNPSLEVRERDGTFQVEAWIGKVQTGEEKWSDSFWIGCTRNETLNLSARVFSDTLPACLTLQLELRIETRNVFDDEVTLDID